MSTATLIDRDALFCRVQYLDEAGERQDFNCTASSHESALQQFRFLYGDEARPQFCCDENGQVTLYVADGITVKYQANLSPPPPLWLRDLLIAVMNAKKGGTR